MQFKNDIVGFVLTKISVFLFVFNIQLYSKLFVLTIDDQNLELITKTNMRER